MNPARTLSLLVTGALVGSFAIAQGMAQDAPQAPAADTSQESTQPAAHESDDPAKTATKPAMLDLRRITPVQGDATAGKAKAEVCSACHGAQGIAIAPLFPNLAGQRAEYLYWQLVEYQRGNVPASAMTPLVADLSEADMRDLAAYFSSLPANPPPPATDTPPADPSAPAPDPASIALGERLYLEGDTAKGIPPCQGCHGADVRGYAAATRPHGGGRMPFAAFPSLRHQHRDYLQTRLDAFRQQQRHATSNDLVMAHVGNRLDEESIQALAAWLSALPPG